MSILADAETGVHGVLSGDATLTALLANGAASVVHGWPTDLLAIPYEDSDFPILTYRVSFARNMRPNAGPFTVVIDQWVWPSGTNGTLARLDAIDSRVEALLEEAQFTVSGRRAAIIDMDVIPWDTESDEPLRRTRTCRGGF